MSANDPLRDPERAPRGWAPPLNVARTVARKVLAEQSGTNIHDERAMLRAAVALEWVLRDLLAALDAEDGGAR